MLPKKHFVLAMVIFILLATAIGYAQESKDIVFTSKSPEALKYFLQGLDLVDNFRISEAGPYFEKAIKADPDFAIAYDYWAGTATSGEEGWKRLNKAVELSKTASEPERLIIMYDQAVSENKLDVARQNVKQLVEVLPQSKRAHYAYALFLDGQQNDNDAENEYKMAISLDPAFAAAYNNYAYFLSRQERYLEAVTALKKYAELKPLEPNPHDSMGEIFLWMGDYANSTKEYENSLKLDPNFVASIAGLGHNLIFKGEFDNARAKYAEMLAHARSANDTVTANYWKAASYLYQTKYDEAMAVFKEQLKVAKARNDVYMEPNIHGYMATIYREKGDYDNALKELALERETAMNPAIESAPQQAYIRECLLEESGILARQGKPDLAKGKLDEYLKAIEGISNPALIRNYHGSAGILAFYSKDYQAAINDLEQANPNNQYYKYYLGLAYEQAGKKEQARKIFSEIAEYNHNGLDYAIVRPAAAAKI